MKNLLILVLSTFAISCQSQIVSLETEAQCVLISNCPEYTYAKDINNSLDKYVGTWKGTYDGKTYELNFKKGLYDDSGMKRDKLVGRARITIPGNFPLTIFDNFNELDDKKTSFSGLGFQPDLKAYMAYFVGPYQKGCINSGTVYVRVKPATPNQMTISYLSDMDIVVGECPNTFTQTFPEKKTITLIKQ
ncbi:DUF6705 family protein [Chryseobacterium daecheongense]|uniref:DUF6705 domain-containing protein n=1 Tax=Chryseobacterium daecheongense TaxID=192389 RepID=A0A3N0W611_9FLAO|nr:DUF6705 family protein [Chryseobacterium daecheongense]ROI00221.1 hypothetical protein EGI05_04875 [Chryseobacterium daecheongense]TDX94822.1 hypothetical protein BCF50_0593 [Chryseobacterium daecheongense]